MYILCMFLFSYKFLPSYKYTREPTAIKIILNEPDDEDNIEVKKMMLGFIYLAMMFKQRKFRIGDIAAVIHLSELHNVLWETKLFGSQNARYLNLGELFSAQALVVVAERQLENRFNVYLVKIDLLANIYCPGGKTGNSANQKLRKGKSKNPVVHNITTWKNDQSREFSIMQRLVHGHLFTVW